MLIEVAVYQVAFHLSYDELTANKSVIYGSSPANSVRFHTQYKIGYTVYSNIHLTCFP